MSFSSLNWAKCVSQTGKIDRLIHDSDSKMAIKISSLAKKAGVCIRIVWIPLVIFTLFGSVVKKHFGSKVSGFGYDPKNCGSFGSMIRFWILVKERNIRFRIKDPDLDFSKETHDLESWVVSCFSSITFNCNATILVKKRKLFFILSVRKQLLDFPLLNVLSLHTDAPSPKQYWGERKTKNVHVMI